VSGRRFSGPLDRAPAATQGQGVSAVSAASPFVVSATILHPLHRVSDDVGAAVAVLTEHQPIELSCLRRVRIRHQMPVAVERRLDRGMAELRLDVTSGAPPGRSRGWRTCGAGRERASGVLPQRTGRSRKRWSRRAIIELRLCPDQGCEINNLPTGRLLARDRRGRSTRSVPAALVMDWNRPCGSRAGRLLGDGELMDQARCLAHRCVRQDLVDCDFAPLIF
jgi:hypothetical protein